jgi:predicted molibdopterin-dependent oxidoreductase YjgC
LTTAPASATPAPSPVWQTFGSGAMTNSIGEIRHADCIFVTGSNTTESHPVIGYEAIRAANNGASLIVVEPRRIPLVDHAALFLQPNRAPMATSLWP